MFKVLTPGARKRRVWSPATVAASVAVHAFLFGGVAVASLGGHEQAPVPDGPLVYIPVPTAPPPPVADPAEPPPPQAPASRTAPVVGATPPLAPPVTVPVTLPPPDGSQASAVPDPGDGPVGDVPGTPVPGDDRPPTGSPEPASGGGDGVVMADALEERPAVENRREIMRLLERSYPPMLRDAGVEGRVVVQFIVNTDGRVDPASITVVSSTTPELDAPSRRAAERMRFRPARVNGQPVRVLTSLPIDWRIPG